MQEMVIVKLTDPTASKKKWLDEMAILFSRGSQIGLDWALKRKTCSRTKIHKATYYKARKLGLPSDYARMAINNSIQHAQSHFGLRKSKRKAGKPKRLRPVIIGIGVHSYALKGTTLRISTGKRGTYKWFPLSVPKKWLDRLQYVKGDAKLFRRGDTWFVSLPLRTPATPPSCTGGRHTVIGVDLGIVRLATAKTPDNVVIWNGKDFRHKREHFFNVRRRFQRHGRMDRVKHSKGKEHRWQQYINHVVSKRLVELACQYRKPVLAFERLDGIRDRVRASKRFNRMMASWAFRDLIDKVKYKAKKVGVELVFVNPAGTSKTCPKCAHSTRSNRPTQGHFRCVKCGYQGNADVVAAINITERAVDLLVHGPSDTARQVPKKTRQSARHGVRG